MKKGLKKCTALTMAAVMTAAALTGCTKPSISVEDSETEDTPLISASAVSFSNKGSYKTTVTSDSIDLSEIGAEDVTIRYNVIDKNGYKKAVEKAEKDAKEKAIGKAFEKLLSQDSDESKKDEKEENEESSDGEETEAIELDVQPEKVNVDTAKFIEVKKAKVTGVKANGDKLELSFTDSDAGKNLTDDYNISFKGKKIKDTQAGADVEVTFKDYKLTPDIKSVASNDKETKLTLTLNEGSFADKVEKSDIMLSGSFESMQVESIISSGKNLTVMLSGTPQKLGGMTTYVDGVIEVSPYAVKDSGRVISTSVPVESEDMFIDSSTIKVDGDKVTASFGLVGVSEDIGKLKPEDFKFEKDVTVTDVKKDSDEQVTLTMTVNGAKDANSAAAVLDGQKLKVSDKEIIVAADEADFYPVFDYVEKSGNNLKITLMLYANNGTFVDNLKTEQITLGGDFAKGKAESLSRESDTTAKLMITVPANGQTAETLDMDGEVTLKAGALVNSWGSKTSTDSKNVRNYCQSSLGRSTDSFSSVDAELEMIKQLKPQLKIINKVMKDEEVSKKMKYFDTSADCQTYNFFYPMLLGTTLEDGEPASVDKGFLNYLVYDMFGQMNIAGNSQNRYKEIADRNNNMKILEKAVIKESFDLDDALGVERKTENQSEKKTQSSENDLYNIHYLDNKLLELDLAVADFAQFFDLYESLGIETPNFDNGASDEITAYSYNLSKAFYDASSKGKKRGATETEQKFKDYTVKYLSLLNKLYEIFNLIQVNDYFTKLDTAYMSIDNFDTTSYFEKVGYRQNVQNKLIKAMSYIRFYNMRNMLEKNSDGTVKSSDAGFDFSESFDHTNEDILSAVESKIWNGVKIYDFEKVDMTGWKNKVFANEAEYAKLSKYTKKEVEEPTYLINGKKFKYYSYTVDYGFLIDENDMPCDPYDTVYQTNPYGYFYVYNHGGASQLHIYHPKSYYEEKGAEIVDTSTREIDDIQTTYCYTLDTEVKEISNDYAKQYNAGDKLNDQMRDKFQSLAKYNDEQINKFFSRLNGRTMLQDFLKAGIPISQAVADSATERGYNTFGVALNYFMKKQDMYGFFQMSNNTRSKYFYWDAKTVNDRCLDDDGVKVYHDHVETFIVPVPVIY